MFDTCADGRQLECLTVVDEWTRECLAIDVAGSLRSARVIEVRSKDGWKLTDNLVVISVDGAGNPIGIAKDGRVWISDHDVGKDSVMADSFEDFILGIVEGRIM